VDVSGTSCDANVACVPAGSAGGKAVPKHGPLLVHALEHPGRRRGFDEGAGDSLSLLTIPAKIDCRHRPAKGDGLRSIRVLSAASEPLMRMPPRRSPPPLHAALHFRDLGIAHEGRAFVTATVAPRSGEPSAA